MKWILWNITKIHFHGISWVYNGSWNAHPNWQDMHDPLPWLLPDPSRLPWIPLLFWLLALDMDWLLSTSTEAISWKSFSTLSASRALVSMKRSKLWLSENWAAIDLGISRSLSHLFPTKTFRRLRFEDPDVELMPPTPAYWSMSRHHWDRLSKEGWEEMS